MGKLSKRRNFTGTATALILSFLLSMGSAAEAPAHLEPVYARTIDRQLALPEDVQLAYASALEEALRAADMTALASQYIVLVDRNANVQAVMIFWRSSNGDITFIGASPASTGRPDGFEHFETPTGVFVHSLTNPDFRAEGTENEFGIYGYGTKGMRVYDFGWVRARRTWGRHGESTMRLQMHSTDPRLLEPRLGSGQSLGCIRIPASLNDFIDRYGILDAEYERAIAAGRTFWVLKRYRTPTPWSGQYLVIVDSGRESRPAWSPPPPPPG